MFCQSYDPPLKLVYYCQKKLKTISKALTTAATAVIAL